MKDFNILKSFCQKIYFVGFGNFWYEEDVGDDRKMIYRIYNVLLFFIYGSMTVLEIFAALLGDFPKDEKGDCVTFAICDDFKEMHKINRRLAVENLATGLIKGFKVHKKLLRILKDIDKGFGFVIALQLFQSSGSAVSLLLQIAISDDLTFVGKLKIMFFVIALFFLLGLFLCNAGEITYQSALLADSIFYCGWHECLWEYQPQGKKIGQMVLIACIQAQKPLVLKAFKMIELTYGTFLWYQFSQVKGVSREEAEKMGLHKTKEVTLEKAYEEIQKIDIDNWENKRGPRPWEMQDEKKK
ncbi:hypothetical protein RR48_02135 [Papilio machaon]|uniref:Uncharacterized protein n=1 Tax=Papilio machaon TaxID=76193 RepID=A0A0N1I7E9_PAPMA|nr:hypothetical protein RR48_02135 [Papilio machaon]